MRASSTMIQKVRIASPCSEDWEKMVGDDRVRHCRECNLNVYNFSAMSQREVNRLIAAKEGRLCARIYQRADGTILTRDCPVALRRLVERLSRIAGAVLSAVSVSLASAQTVPKQQPFVQIGQQEGGLQIDVVDGSGTPVANAKMVLTPVTGNKAKAKSISGKTDSRGHLRLSPLPIGNYAITVRRADSETYSRYASLSGGQMRRLRIELQMLVPTGGVIIVPTEPLIPLVPASAPMPVFPPNELPKLVPNAKPAINPEPKH
jgi:hypothetical protein